MRKTRKILTCFLACMLFFSNMIVHVNALKLIDDSATVYLDDVRVKNITAYLDNNDDVRVLYEDDLRKIFPEEMEDLSVIPATEGFLLSYWCNYFGYTYEQDRNRFYIFSEEILSIPNEDKDEDIDEISVFVNGNRINDVGAYLYKKEIYINNYQVLYKLFPKETKDTYFSTTKEATTLKSWAERYNYKYVVNRKQVYLNNDNNKPVEIKIDGKRVVFPDQQPIIVSPGRTLVPVRTVSEMFGAMVAWDAKNSRVLIKDNTHQLAFFIGSKTYYLNGKWKNMDVSATIINNRTMVPIRFIAEAFGYKVNFDGTGKIDVVKLSS